MKRGANIPEVLKDIRHSAGGMFLSDEIQMADIIEIIVRQIGKCSIFQTSFSVSEEFLRRLFLLKQSGQLSFLSLILDHKATIKTAKLWNFVKSVFSEVYLSANHSKILLFLSESGDKISIISSQNLTRGNRFEAYAISTSKKDFDSLFNSFVLIKDNNSITANGIFRGAD